MSESLNDKELQAFAADLKALTPVAATIDRDRLMFRAGQESMRRQRRPWLVSAAVLLVCLVGVSALLIRQMNLPPVERVVVVEREVPASAPKITPSPARTLPRDAEEEQIRNLAYLELRQQVLRWGAEGLPGLPQAPPLPAKTSAQPDNLLALHARGTPGSLLQWFTGQSGENE